MSPSTSVSLSQPTIPESLAGVEEESTSASNQAGAQIQLQPAGGPDPAVFDWAEAWYPVHYVADLDPSRPTPFTLLGQDLVLWLEPTTQQWRAMVDQCPHRLARLSEGRISEEGQLECPYHGWTFSGSGRCERIPQLAEPEAAIAFKRACVQSLPVEVRQGLLFVYPGKPENAAKTAIPIIEAMEETPDEWVCLNTFRDLPYDALTLLENVLDASHVPYTHHRTVGNRANAAPVELEVLEAGKQGFTGRWQEGPRRGTLGQQDTVFVAPNYMCHDLTSKQFGRTLTVVYATPIRKGECRLFARFPFKFSSPWPRRIMGLTPRWYSHISQNSILEDDQIFLHHQERYLAAAGGSDRLSQAFFLPTKADLFVLELHKWLREFQAQPFPEGTLPPALSKEQLLDRYHSHTVHCASCRQALTNIQRIRTGLAFGSVIAGCLLPWLFFGGPTALGLKVGASLLTLTLFGTWFGLGHLVRQFYEGRKTPPRNLPEKVKRSAR